MAPVALWLRRGARACPPSNPAAALRCRWGAALRAPLLSAAAHRPAHRRLLSDRADYTHTERELSKGRRATERAAYATLGVSHDATEPEIKAQFRSLAKLYHPDITAAADEPAAAASGGGGGTDKMSELVAAFDLVMGSDLSKRASSLRWGELGCLQRDAATTQLRRPHAAAAVSRGVRLWR